MSSVDVSSQMRFSLDTSLSSDLERQGFSEFTPTREKRVGGRERE
jgi:hypothetical protein